MNRRRYREATTSHEAIAGYKPLFIFMLKLPEPLDLVSPSVGGPPNTSAREPERLFGSSGVWWPLLRKINLCDALCSRVAHCVSSRVYSVAEELRTNCRMGIMNCHMSPHTHQLYSQMTNSSAARSGLRASSHRRLRATARGSLRHERGQHRRRRLAARRVG